jgi:hypothetical protein
VDQASADVSNHSLFRVNGSAKLTRGFGRSWSAWGGYLRGVDFLAGFPQPVLTDTVTTGVSGLITSTLKLSGASGITKGTLGIDTDTSFSTDYASVRVEYAATRMIGIYSDYTYYHYRIPSGQTLLDIVPRFSRQTITAGLTVWLPIINQARAPRDPR